MAKGILLDLDNTLYEYGPCHREGLTRVYQYVKDHAQVSFEIFNMEFNKAKMEVKKILGETAASHNRLLYMQRLCEQLCLSAPTHALIMYESYWTTFLSKMRLSEDAKTFLDKHKNKPICIVTDLTSHIQYRKVKALGLHRWVDFIVTSEDAGHEKPHPFIFEMALRKLELSVWDVCMVGDSMQKDIEGAVSLGIQSYWYSRFTSKSRFNEEHKLIKQIDSLDDVDW